METVFKIPTDIAAYARREYECPITISVEQECYQRYFINLTKEEFEQIEQGDKVVILRDVKIEVEMP